MTVPSYVVDAAAAALRSAAADIDTPAARALSERADKLVLDPEALAAGMVSAIQEVEDGRLAALALEGLALPSVAATTANRRLQARNRAALIDLARGLATVRLAERTGERRFAERTGAVRARDTAGDALDARAGTADTETFRALRTLRAAVVSRVSDSVRDLPDVIEATPGAIRPSLALAYDIYGDIGRAGEIAARNRLARPGFVPSRPIAILSS